MSWGFQIKKPDPATGADVWLWVSPSSSSGGRYEYKTEAQAQRMMEMCYPDSTFCSVRTQEIPK
jgi:hypothetical protein